MSDATMNNVLFSSHNEVWATPQNFYDKLNEEFGFNLDPCALPENAKCDRFFTPEDDGLKQSWGGQMFSATLLTERRSVPGCKSAMRKAASLIHWWCCLSLPGLIRHIFTITSTIRPGKSALSVVGLNLVMRNRAHRFPQWL